MRAIIQNISQWIFQFKGIEKIIIGEDGLEVRELDSMLRYTSIRYENLTFLIGSH